MYQNSCVLACANAMSCAGSWQACYRRGWWHVGCAALTSACSFGCEQHHYVHAVELAASKQSKQGAARLLKQINKHGVRSVQVAS